MVRLPTAATTKSVKHENTNQLNSTTIDFIAYANTLNKTANCQLKNDVENLGLLRYNNGKTISINFKQTKEWRNATNQPKAPRCGIHLNKTGNTLSGYMQLFRTKRSTNSQYFSKMHIIAVSLLYLAVFSIQSATARPNVNRIEDSASNWQSIALTSENKVSSFFLVFLFLMVIQCYVIY